MSQIGRRGPRAVCPVEEVSRRPTALSSIQDPSARLSLARVHAIRSLVHHPHHPHHPHHQVCTDTAVKNTIIIYLLNNLKNKLTKSGPDLKTFELMASTTGACNVSAWSAWSNCSVLCGGGVQISTRFIVTPGVNCPPLNRTRLCNPVPCIRLECDNDQCTSRHT